MNIVELLKLRGLNTSAKVKLIRHQDARYPLLDMYREDKQYVEIYQSYQAKPVFNDCEYIVSFIGLENSQALLIGVYKVHGVKPAGMGIVPPSFPYTDSLQGAEIYYSLEPVPGFEDIEGRVIIDWGKAALAWHQWLTEKEVVEILPKGYVMEFPGYLDFSISFLELEKIIKTPSVHREWHRALAEVAGVYLIVDCSKEGRGQQYVGSAYGQKGILGRWEEYVRTKHGGNVRLMSIIEKDPLAVTHFTFSILQTLPRALTMQEVIQKESFYKRKLGSRAFGLNMN